jgi:serine O-acetyltransferase
MLKTLHIESTQIAAYVRTQLERLFPLPSIPDLEVVDQYVPAALKRLNRCVNEVKVWSSDQFDVLHSSQYCIFLYYLANTIWKETGDRDVCTLLFLLNKSLNGIDLFYEIEMPEVFFIGHSVGIVLAKATYGNYLVLYQNSTVGKNHGIAPVLEDRVIMYPNTAIIGRSHVKAGSVIAQGVSVINQDTPGDCLVFRDSARGVAFKDISRDIFREIFVY